MRAFGIDISKYDGKTFTPERAKRTIDFVIQRASYGMYKDEAFDSLVEGSLKVNIRGFYHYLSSAVPWREQGDRFIEIVEKHPHHFLVCDFEGAYNNLNASFVDSCRSFMEYVRQKTGKIVVLYTNPNIYDNVLMRYAHPEKPWPEHWPLWIAQYPYIIPNAIYENTKPRLPAKRRTSWAFWQYTDKGNGEDVGLPEAKGVDLNVFNGSTSDLEEWLMTKEFKPGTQEQEMLKDRIAELAESIRQASEEIAHIAKGLK